MESNVQGGGPEDRHYERFERLPERFRKLLWTARTNYKVGWIEKLIKQFGEAKAFELAARLIWQERIATIIQYYGRSHPQVGR